jgi:competence protein ComEA
MGKPGCGLGTARIDGSVCASMLSRQEDINKRRAAMGRRKRFAALVLASMMVLVSAVVAGAGETTRINVNTASAEELTQLKGVGPEYAARIIAYREENGPFKTPQDLMKVKGIGVKTIENNKERIVFEDAKRD